MINKLIIYGAASERIIKIIEFDDALDTNLMDFLISRSIKVASSCSGEGVCKKCILYQDSTPILSCQKNLRNLFSTNNVLTLTINYL